MYDSVFVRCSSCDQYLEFRSEGGSCQGNGYTIQSAPDAIMRDVNSCAPVTCSKCGSSFAIVEAWNGTVRYWIVPWSKQKAENERYGLIPGYMGLLDPTH